TLRTPLHTRSKTREYPISKTHPRYAHAIHETMRQILVTWRLTKKPSKKGLQTWVCRAPLIPNSKETPTLATQNRRRMQKAHGYGCRPTQALFHTMFS